MTWKSFLSVRHLKDWLAKSVEGNSVLDELRPENISEWLEHSLEGRRILGEAMWTDAPRRQVLVVMYGDGVVDVYANRDVDVEIVMAPLTQGNAKHELKAEEWIESRLPTSFKTVFFPALIRKTGDFRVLTDFDMQNEATSLAWDQALLKALEAVTK